MNCSYPWLCSGLVGAQHCWYSTDLLGWTLLHEEMSLYFLKNWTCPLQNHKPLSHSTSSGTSLDKWGIRPDVFHMSLPNHLLKKWINNSKWLSNYILSVEIYFFTHSFCYLTFLFWIFKLTFQMLPPFWFSTWETHYFPSLLWGCSTTHPLPALTFPYTRASSIERTKRLSFHGCPTRPSPATNAHRAMGPPHVPFCWWFSPWKLWRNWFFL